MSSKRNTERPLIHEAEGRDQDERSQLIAAVVTLLDRSDRRTVTDLHLVELVKWVHRLDKGKVGAQLSTYQIAKQLFVEVPTVRKILRRATDELQLLLKVEQRYVSNGQQANRYEINWPLIRAINRGRKPGDTMDQGGDTLGQGGDPMYQGADTMDHPYKEYYGLIPESNTESPPTPCAGESAQQSQEEESFANEISTEPHEPRTTEFQCVAPSDSALPVDASYEPAIAPESNPSTAGPLSGSLVLVRTERPRATGPVVDLFRRAQVWDADKILDWVLPEVGEQYLRDLLAYWREHCAEWTSPAALRERLKRSNPDLAISDGWPPRNQAPPPPEKRKSSEQLAAEREAFLRERTESRRLAAESEGLGDVFRKLRNGVEGARRDG